MIVLQKTDISKYADMDERLKDGLLMIAEGAVDNAPLGKKEDSDCMYHNVQSYETKLFEATRYESHELWIDIQYIRKGQERIDVCVNKEGLKEVERNEEADCIFYENDETACVNQVCLKEGMLAVFYPEDIHRPCISVDGAQKVEKIVFKVRV